MIFSGLRANVYIDGRTLGQKQAPDALWVLILPLSWEQVVCRGCSRNRYPLKYLKDRVAKVCDHCYAELRKKGESQLGGGGVMGQS